MADEPLMPDDPQMPAGDKSWWVTLPGLVTAIAGLATAIGGLILVLSQTGMIGEHKADTSVSETQADPPAVSESSPPAPDAGEVADQTAPALSPAPVAQQGASILRRDGDRIDVRPGTLKNDVTGDSLTLRNGQTVPLDRVSQLNVLDSQDTEGFVTVEMVLTTGQTIKGQIDSRYSIAATNEVGPVAVKISDIKTVAFGR